MDVNWISNDPEKYRRRLLYELEEVNKSFPLYRFNQEEDEMFIEGPLITRSNNVYLTRIYYPSSFPYSPPIPVVLDKDVVKTCCDGGAHNYHNYGKYKDGGVKLCVIKPDDSVGEGWKPNYSIKTIINLVCIWLHGYEVKIKNPDKKWVLPEA